MPFAAYTAAGTQNDFQWAGQLPIITPSHGGFWTLSNTWFLGPTRVTIPPPTNAVFTGLTNLTNIHTHRQRDHATPSVAIGAHSYCRDVAQKKLTQKEQNSTHSLNVVCSLNLQVACSNITSLQLVKALTVTVSQASIF